MTKRVISGILTLALLFTLIVPSGFAIAAGDITVKVSATRVNRNATASIDVMTNTQIVTQAHQIKLEYAEGKSNGYVTYNSATAANASLFSTASITDNGNSTQTVFTVLGTGTKPTLEANASFLTLKLDVSSTAKGFIPVTIDQSFTEICAESATDTYQLSYIDGGIVVLPASVSAATQPTKKAYFVGDALDLSGMTATLKYSEATDDTLVVPYAEFAKYGIQVSLSDGAELEEAGQVKLTVSMDDVAGSAETYVDVTAVQDSAIIKATDLMALTKTSYIEDETFSAEGLSVKIEKNNGSASEAIDYSNLATNNLGLFLGTTATDATSLTTSTKLTLSDNGKKVFVKGINGTQDKTGLIALEVGTLTVTAKVPSSIEITAQPSDMSYYTNQTFDPTGLKVTVKHEDGGDDVDISDTTIATLNDKGVHLYVTPEGGAKTELDDETPLLTTMNGKKISVEYLTFSAETTGTLTVVDAKIKGITKTTDPKLKYVAGEKFVGSAARMTLTYEDNSTQTDAEFSSPMQWGYCPEGSINAANFTLLTSGTTGLSKETHNGQHLVLRIIAGNDALASTASAAGIYVDFGAITVVDKTIYSVAIDEIPATAYTYHSALILGSESIAPADNYDFTGVKIDVTYGESGVATVVETKTYDPDSDDADNWKFYAISAGDESITHNAPVNEGYNGYSIKIYYGSGFATYMTNALSITAPTVTAISATKDKTTGEAFVDNNIYKSNSTASDLQNTNLYAKLIIDNDDEHPVYVAYEKFNSTYPCITRSLVNRQAVLTYEASNNDLNAKTCQYDVSVAENYYVARAIGASALKVDYIENQSIDMTNAQICMAYKRGTSDTVQLPSYNVTLSASDVKLYYGSMPTALSLTVEKTKASKAEKAGCFANGDELKISVDNGVTILPVKFLDTTYKNVTFNVVDDYIIGISFDALQKPDKSEYIVGQKLDLTGLEINASRASGGADVEYNLDSIKADTDFHFYVGATDITADVKNASGYTINATTPIVLKYERTTPAVSVDAPLDPSEATLNITITPNTLKSISTTVTPKLAYYITGSTQALDMSGLSILKEYQDNLSLTTEQRTVPYTGNTDKMVFYVSSIKTDNPTTDGTLIANNENMAAKQGSAYKYDKMFLYVSYTDNPGQSASALVGQLSITDRAIKEIIQADTFPGSFCIVEEQGWESVTTGSNNDDRVAIADDTIFLQIVFNDAPSVKIDVTKNDLKSTVNTYGINVDFALLADGDGKNSLATTDSSYYLRFKSANGIVMIANSRPVTVLEKVVTGIAIKTQPSDLAYIATEPIKLDGIVVTLTWNDATTADIALTDFTTNGLSAKIDSTPITSGTTKAVVAMNGKPITITHTPSNKTATTQNISVADRKVTGITVKTAPADMEYIAGQVLNLTDLEITKTYNSQAETAGTYDTAEVDAAVIFGTDSGYTVSVDGTTISGINSFATTDAMNGKAIKILYAGTASDPVNGASVDCTTTSTLRITPLRVTAVAFVGQPTVDASNLLQLDDVTVQLTYNDMTKANTPIAYINCAEAGLTFTIDGKIAADEMQLTKAAHDGKKVRVSYKYSDTLCAESTALTVKDVVSTDNSLYMVKLTYEGETYIGSISGYGISFGIPTEVNFTQIGDSNFSIIPKDSKATHTTLTPGSSGTFTFTIEAENGTKSDAYTITVTSNVSSDTAAEEEAKALKALINGNLDKDVEGSMIVGSTEDDKQAALKEILENRVNRIIADSGLTGYTAEVTLGESYNDFDFDSDGTFAGATITLKRNNASIVNLDPISNVGGTISATGTVNPQVNVTSDATGAFVPLNTEVILTATPNGDFKTTDPVITYQWYYAPSNGTPDVLTGEKIIGETNSTFTTSSATAQTKYVFCVATGESVAGVAIEKTSAMITLTFGEIYREPIAGKPILDNNGSTITKIGEVASATKTYSVIARKLNIRTGMSTSFKKVGMLSYGDLVQVKTINGDWSMIEINGIDRFVNNKYLRPVDLGTEYNGLVTPRVLNVRSGPGTTYSKLGRLTRNTPVRILELKDGWYKIVYGDSVAYVSSKYIQVTMPITGTSNVVKGTVT